MNVQNLLCKAKRKDNGEWIEGYYCPKKAYCFDNRTPSLHCIISEFSSTGIVAIEIDINTLCRNTGIRDIQGKFIWENDVVNTYRGEYYKVEYDENNGSYIMMQNGSGCFNISADNVRFDEIVSRGSLLDNPEYKYYVEKDYIEPIDEQERD